MENSLLHSSKEVFLQTFRQFLENWIFDGKSTAADPYKNGENFVLSQNELRKYFLAKFLCSTHQKKCFYKLLAVFGKLNFWRKIDSRGPYKNGENFVLSQNVRRKYFWQNSLFHSSKEVFLQTFRQFLENWIFDGKSTAADLTKMVKILYYLKMC